MSPIRAAYLRAKLDPTLTDGAKKAETLRIRAEFKADGREVLVSFLFSAGRFRSLRSDADELHLHLSC